MLLQPSSVPDHTDAGPMRMKLIEVDNLTSSAGNSPA